MLVKLGDIWVDPQQVIFITSNSNVVSLSVKEDGFVGAIPIFIAESRELALVFKDEFASIVNNSIGQSYGGQDEETKEGV